MATANLTDEDILAIAQAVVDLMISGSVPTDYGVVEEPFTTPTGDDRQNYYLAVIKETETEKEAGNMNLSQLYDAFESDAKAGVDSYIETTSKPTLDAYVTTKEGEIDTYVDNTVKPSLDSYVEVAKGYAEEAEEQAEEAESQAQTASGYVTEIQTYLTRAEKAVLDAEEAVSDCEAVLADTKAEGESLLSDLQALAQAKVVSPIMVEGEMYGYSLHTDGGDLFLDISEIEEEEEESA